MPNKQKYIPYTAETFPTDHLVWIAPCNPSIGREGIIKRGLVVVVLDRGVIVGKSSVIDWDDLFYKHEEIDDEGNPHRCGILVEEPKVKNFIPKAFQKTYVPWTMGTAPLEVSLRLKKSHDGENPQTLWRPYYKNTDGLFLFRVDTPNITHYATYENLLSLWRLDENVFTDCTCGTLKLDNADADGDIEF